MYENDFIKLESEIEDLKTICKDFQIMLKYSDNKDIICDLVQEKVIEGVKHVKNGSKDFEIYYLKEIVKDSNVKKIRFAPPKLSSWRSPS